MIYEEFPYMCKTYSKAYILYIVILFIEKYVDTQFLYKCAHLNSSLYWNISVLCCVSISILYNHKTTITLPDWLTYSLTDWLDSLTISSGSIGKIETHTRHKLLQIRFYSVVCWMHGKFNWVSQGKSKLVSTSAGVKVSTSASLTGVLGWVT